MAAFHASEPSLATPAGAASLARVRAATGNAPPRVVGVRSAWWECKYPVRACAFFACSKSNDNPFVQAVCCGLGILAGLISTCFCVARRRERESFVVVVTEGDFAASRENKGWSCGDDEGEVILEAGRAANVVKVQRHASLLWEFGTQPCGDDYWLNCFCDGGFPCWDTLAVYLADPVTGRRKVVKCCGCECWAPPDYRWDCLKDARAVEAAMNEAHSHSGASKIENAAVMMAMPMSGNIVMVAPAPQYAMGMPQQQQQQQLHLQNPLGIPQHPSGYAMTAPPQQQQYPQYPYATTAPPPQQQNYPMGYLASAPPPGYKM